MRVERAIKRVRSDLAAHVASPSAGDVRKGESKATRARRDSDGFSMVEDDRRSVRDEVLEEKQEDGEEAQEEGEGEIDERPETPRSPRPQPIEAGSAAAPAEGEEANAPSTPVANESHVSRIPRSQSADPDKAARMSRVFKASLSPSHDNDTTGTSTQTEDDSSISTSHEQRRAARKKRSKSADPNRELKKMKSQRKVQVSDFEMMRVLGKGCAGKVLLVKHRSSSDLFALKAITKRHVLAHQELQHTLTEQAVLKRMAASNSDPFVVKLWWSFHDKENLFLVMVSSLFFYLYILS